MRCHMCDTKFVWWLDWSDVGIDSLTVRCMIIPNLMYDHIFPICSCDCVLLCCEGAVVRLSIVLKCLIVVCSMLF